MMNYIILKVSASGNAVIANRDSMARKGKTTADIPLRITAAANLN